MLARAGSFQYVPSVDLVAFTSTCIRSGNTLIAAGEKTERVSKPSRKQTIGKSEAHVHVENVNGIAQPSYATRF